MNISASETAKFLKSTFLDGDCIRWSGARSHNGYGVFSFRGRKIRAHRFSFLASGKTIPVGLMVLHRCDVRDCVNPSHLFTGTALDNAQDAITKGRHTKDKNLIGGESHGGAHRGEEHPSSKLTTKKVLEMRRLHSLGIGFHKLGKMFGVSKPAAKKAVRGVTWTHI